METIFLCIYVYEYIDRVYICIIYEKVSHKHISLFPHIFLPLSPYLMISCNFHRNLPI